MSGLVEITSPLQFRTFAGSHTYTIVDFYATWCPPCKAIAPIYAQLASTHSASGAFAFLKVNVDEQQELAQQFGIQAMPTFVLLKDGKPVDTIRGANPPALKKAIEGASAAAAQEAKARETSKSEVKEDVKAEDEVKAEENTVSGSYGMTGGSNWKMSLN